MSASARSNGYQPLTSDSAISVAEQQQNAEDEEDNLEEPAATERVATIGDFVRHFDGFTDWFLLALGLVACLLSGVILPAATLIFKDMVDEFLRAQYAVRKGTLDFDKFYDKCVPYCQQYFMFAGAMFLCTFINDFCLARLFGRLALSRLPLKLFANFLGQDQEWYDRLKPDERARIVAHFASGMDQIGHLSKDLTIFLRGLTACVSAFAIGFWMSWKVAALLSGISPFLLFAFWMSAGTTASSIGVTRKSQAQQGSRNKSSISQKRHELNAFIASIIEAVKIVINFGTQPQEIEGFRSRLEALEGPLIRQKCKLAVCYGLSLAAMFCGMGITFWYGMNRVLEGELKAGTVFGCFWAIIIGIFQLSQALPQFPAIVQALREAGQIFRTIDQIKGCSNADWLEQMKQVVMAVDDHMLTGRVQLANVRFAYPAASPSRMVLHDFCLEVKAGQKVVILGKSGSGKSTVSQLLLGLYTPNGGSIMFYKMGTRGYPVWPTDHGNDFNKCWIRQRIAIVKAEPDIFSGTIRDFLLMACPLESVSEEEMMAISRNVRAHDFIIACENGYDTAIGQGGVSLSGGQRQRLAIGQALMRRSADIFIFDEPTSALDVHTERAVMDELFALPGTVLIITHRLCNVHRADKIVLMENGRITDQGSHGELLRSSAYYRHICGAALRSPGEGKESDAQEQQQQTTTASEPPPSTSSMAKNVAAVEPTARQPAKERQQQQQRHHGSEHCLVNSVDTDSEGGASGIKEKSVETNSGSILANVRPFLISALIGLLFAVVRGFAWPLLAVDYGRLFLLAVDMIDDPGAKDQMRINILVVSSGMAVIGLFSFVCAGISGALFGRLGVLTSHRMGLKAFKSLLYQDGHFFDRSEFSKDKLTTTLLTSLHHIQAAIDLALADLFQGYSALLIGLGLGIFFGWHLALISFGLSLAAILLKLLITRCADHCTKKCALQLDQFNEKVLETIGSGANRMGTVITMNLQLRFYECAESALLKASEIAWRTDLWQSLAHAVMLAQMPLNTGATYWIGLLLIGQNTTDPYNVFQVVEALRMALFMFVTTMTAYMPLHTLAKMAESKLRAIIENKPLIDSESTNGFETQINGDIRFQQLSFAYDQHGRQNVPNVLEDIHLDLPAGQTLALVGPSGSGKSTMLALLARMYEPSKGLLFVDNLDIRAFNVRHLRRHMAIIEQQPALFGGKTILENICYGLEENPPHMHWFETIAELTNVDGIGQGYNTLASRLSSGEKQRVAIARALIRQPRILLLDEPTSALDNANEKLLLDALRKYPVLAKHPLTCVLVTHRLELASQAQQIAVLRDGRIVECGSADELEAKRGDFWQMRCMEGLGTEANAGTAGTSQQ